jgi:predicted nucleotidyltransferase component of viral defense system
MKDHFIKQVKLLVKILPIISHYDCFALKGGTAINLFYENLPRLSVDIDLVYLPLKNRDEALMEISDAFISIGKQIENSILNSKIHYSKITGSEYIIKLIVRQNDLTVKVEISPVLRGTVFKSVKKRITKLAEKSFGFVEMQVVSFEDLYAGKILAALDRQHPRDLFDIQSILETGKISKNLKQAFLVYLISHNRRMIEILNPREKDISKEFAVSFSGMTNHPLDLVLLQNSRGLLIKQINSNLDFSDKKFLLGFLEGNPNWDHFSLKHIKNLPAVKWKRYNLNQIAINDKKKLINELRTYLNI